MNAPERIHLNLAAPACIQRRTPAAQYGWWSDRTLQIIKGDDVITLDADDLRTLRRFFDQFDLDQGGN